MRNYDSDLFVDISLLDSRATHTGLRSPPYCLLIMSGLPENLAVKVPAGFQELLKDLSREVIRSQPDDIHQFCANFFQTRLNDRERLTQQK